MKFKAGDLVKVLPGYDIAYLVEGSEWDVERVDEDYVYIKDLSSGVNHAWCSVRFELVSPAIYYSNEESMRAPYNSGPSPSLTTTSPGQCNCDLVSQLLPYGCNCGGS